MLRVTPSSRPNCGLTAGSMRSEGSVLHVEAVQTMSRPGGRPRSGGRRSALSTLPCPVARAHRQRCPPDLPPCAARMIQTVNNGRPHRLETVLGAGTGVTMPCLVPCSICIALPCIACCAAQESDMVMGCVAPGRWMIRSLTAWSPRLAGFAGGGAGAGGGGGGALPGGSYGARERDEPQGDFTGPASLRQPHVKALSSAPCCEQAQHVVTRGTAILFLHRRVCRT